MSHARVKDIWPWTSTPKSNIIIWMHVRLSNCNFFLHHRQISIDMMHKKEYIYFSAKDNAITHYNTFVLDFWPLFQINNFVWAFFSIQKPVSHLNNIWIIGIWIHKAVNGTLNNLLLPLIDGLKPWTLTPWVKILVVMG